MSWEVMNDLQNWIFEIVNVKGFVLFICILGGINMLPLFAAAAAAAAWEGFAAGVLLGVSVYQAVKSDDQLLVDILRKVDDSMYPYIGFAVGLIVCKLCED